MYLSAKRFFHLPSSNVAKPMAPMKARPMKATGTQKKAKQAMKAKQLSKTAIKAHMKAKPIKEFLSFLDFIGVEAQHCVMLEMQSMLK